MSIRVSEDGRQFFLETKTSSYRMKADELGTLRHLYYGEKSGGDDLPALFHAVPRGHDANPHETGMKDRDYGLESIPQEYSGFGGADYRTTALRARFEDGTRTVRLRFESYRIEAGKYAIPGLPAAYDDRGDAETLVITLRDAETGLKAELYYAVFEEADVITRAVKVTNETAGTVTLEKCASLALDFPARDYDLMTFFGRWAKERTPERVKLAHGIRAVQSLRGASSLQYNPSALLLAPETTETSGEGYGIAFVYSGSFLLEAEKDPAGDVRLQLGIHPDLFSWKLAPGECFYAPEALLTWSNAGVSGISHHFHDFINRSIVRGKWRDAERPVLLNNWEGTYFHFDGEKLVAMAKAAAEIGVNLFVLDDGWFGKRDDDRSGLGDWQPNEAKIGCSIRELGEKVRAAGTAFGIWFEPEAVSEDSDLFRAHPDWAIAVPGREPSLARYELLLDLGRKDVQDRLIEDISSVIRASGAVYLKWDFNRSISDRYSAALPADRQGEFDHRYMLGVYRVLETLREAFPELLIEGCSSGGGRFDAGMLYYTPQIWTSDDTDPIERLMIQYGTSMIYPVRTMGAHVSASPNHQTGRKTPLHTRAVVAMSGTFGFELDVTKAPEEEKAEMREELETFRALYGLLQFGDLYRLLPPTDENCTVWEQAAKDGSRALLSTVRHTAHAARVLSGFQVQGLKDEAMYRVRMVREKDVEKLDDTSKTLFDGRTVSGRALRTAGLYVPVTCFPEEYEAFQILIEEA